MKIEREYRILYILAFLSLNGCINHNNKGKVKIIYYDNSTKIYKKDTFVANNEFIRFTFDIEGVLYSKCPYKDNKPNGKLEVFYPNGKTNAEAEFKDGQKDGSYKVFDEKGGTIDIKYYSRDKLIKK
jgi:antitoxin component YwqK of YwqJK toxin-antitoxin module